MLRALSLSSRLRPSLPKLAPSAPRLLSTTARPLAQCAAPRLLTPAVRPLSLCAAAAAPAARPAASLCARRILGGAAPRRALSTSSIPPNWPKATMVAQAVSWMSHNRTMVAVMCGASIVVYGLYRFSVRTMKFFFHVSDKEIFTIGFATGLVAAAGIAAAVLLVNRFITFQPDHLYRAALQELRKNSAVEEALGGFWRPTNFRGYAAESLEEAVRGSERRARSTYLEAPSRRMQMVFGVQGAKHDGVVSLEAHKRGTKIWFDMLSLDVRGSKQHMFLKGDKDRPLFPEIAEVLGGLRK